MQNRSSALRFFLDNLGWLAGSLLLAVIVWYVAWSAQNPVEQRRLPSSVPIQVLTNDDMLVVGTPPATAEVTIRAPHSVWDVLEAQDVSVVADLTKKQPGTYTVPLTATLSDARRGAVVDIQPSQITVQIARRSEQLVSITIVRTSEPPPGFTATITPAEPNAKIVGPETDVKRVATVAARISLQDQRSGFSRVVPLTALDAANQEVSNVKITPAEVTLNVEIQPKSGVTELSIVPKLVGELPQGYIRRNYSWDPKTVAVRGDQFSIDSMSGIVYTDPIDLTGQTTTFTQHVKLALPAGVTVIDPVEVTVTVNIEPLVGSREFDNIPVQPQGLDPADFAITVQPDHVSVIVSGPQAALEALAESDINVIAPLAGLSAGKTSVNLQASITKPGFTNQDIVIPNAKAEVTIVALHPTATPTAGPTRTPEPTVTPTVEPSPTP
jgi:YbbR domain-containing protein